MSATVAPTRLDVRDSVPNPADPRRRVRAVLFDVDGTLYDQRRMRRLMAWELLTGLVMRHPIAAPGAIRALREFRRAQERLRVEGRSGAALDLQQFELAAAAAGTTVEAVALVVREWMEERPLKHLHRCGTEAVRELFEFLAGTGVKIGVFSDYPARAKLRTLGVLDRCSLVFCASDPGIGVFKPHPRGFLAACEHWGLPPADVLMVGDRADADGAGAAAAGMPCVIVGRNTPVTDVRTGTTIPSLERLRRVLDDSH